MEAPLRSTSNFGLSQFLYQTFCVGSSQNSPLSTLTRQGDNTLIRVSPSTIVNFSSVLESVSILNLFIIFSFFSIAKAFVTVNSRTKKTIFLLLFRIL